MNQKGVAYNKIKDVFSDYIETTGSGLNLGLSIMKFWSNRNFNSIDSLLYPLQQIVDDNGKILDNAGLKDELNHFYNSVDKLEEEINKTFKSTINAMSGISLDISELDNNIKKGNFLKKVTTKRHEAPGVGVVSPPAKINATKESNKTENEETKPNKANEEVKEEAKPAKVKEEVKPESPNKLEEKSKKKSKGGEAPGVSGVSPPEKPETKKGGRRRTLKKALKKRNRGKLSKIRFN
jgi:hypothetical protein